MGHGRLRRHFVAGPSPRAADESGFILIVAILMLLVVTVLVAAVATATIDVSNSSAQTTARDRALAAATAGAQVALFRLNTTGAMSGQTGSLGHGATYTYAVSNLSASSTPCAGLWVQNSGRAVQQACITSSGSVGNLSVRVQDRVVGYTPSSPIFPVDGIFAVNGFSAGQNFSDQGDIRSNGPISVGGGTSTINGNLEYLAGNAPSGSYFCNSPCNPVQESAPLPVPTGSSTSATAYANAAASNNDAAISWGTNIYNAATHTVTAGSGTGGTVTIPSGTYYFCSIDLNNSTTLQASITNSQPVVIYIDSPYDASSNCANGTGNITAGNNFVTTNPTLIASNFQIYFFGQPGCTTSCPDNFTENDQTYNNVQLYAPYSSLTTTNNIAITGDLVIGMMTVKNNASFTYAGSGGSSGSGGVFVNYYPSAQESCVPSSTPGGTAGAC